MRGQLLFALLFLSACTTTKAIGPDEPSAPPVQSVPSPSPAPSAVPPDLTFGAPCKADDAIHCGTKLRVAVMVQNRSSTLEARTGVPCTMQTIAKPDFGERSAGCVKDDRVYITADCLECRMSSSWDLTGIVAEMTDQQLTTTQERVGIPATPLLRTPDAWRGAIAKAAAAPPRRR